MFAPDPAQSRPKAPSPKAPSLGTTGSYLSFSSAETLTPESGAGGRPSRASAVDTLSPQSRPGLDISSVSKVSVQNSSRDTLAEAADGASRHPGGGRVAGGRRSGELRRRKYTALGHQPQIPEHTATTTAANSGTGSGSVEAAAVQAGTVKVKLGGATPEALQARNGPSAASPGAAAAAATAGPAAAAATQTSGANGQTRGELEECEVLIEGPLQQRHLLVFWRWRWCVLDRQELRIYWNEEASLLMPEKPIERRSVVNLDVGPDLHFPSVLICADSRTGEPLSFLRAGPGLRWEEVAASTLWLRAFAAAGRWAASRQRGSRPAHAAVEGGR